MYIEDIHLVNPKKIVQQEENTSKVPVLNCYSNKINIGLTHNFAYWPNKLDFFNNFFFVRKKC
jgi:hypothetical protein